MERQIDTRVRRRWFIAGGALAALALTTGILAATGAFTPGPKDLNGNPVIYEADAVPDPAASAVPDGSGRFVASTVGLDVPVGSLDAVDGVVTPPGFTSAYLIRNYGVTPKEAGLGTVYVVMHSLRNGGNGPGNALIDVEQEKARLVAGDTIDVDDVAYRVTGSQHLSKDQLPSSEIWAGTPNTLVVITCLQRPDGAPSTDNLIITAEREQ